MQRPVCVLLSLVCLCIASSARTCERRRSCALRCTVVVSAPIASGHASRESRAEQPQSESSSRAALWHEAAEGSGAEGHERRNESDTTQRTGTAGTHEQGQQVI